MGLSGPGQREGISSGSCPIRWTSRISAAPRSMVKRIKNAGSRNRLPYSLTSLFDRNLSMFGVASLRPALVSGLLPMRAAAHPVRPVAAVNAALALALAQGIALGE